ncbi:MAG TPA: protein kinase [Gemmatimonadales bacterium]|nr:protein kinase [Gemmatimonadales bacterium]
MSDLETRLQEALKSTYRLEKELGGGGMSRVFLAEELALGRKVVIKVLPPDMAAGVNVERFRREIQLAASLQHPHIVPLHAAGQTGDLFYYTMPLVEGESLRAKLSREGELPIGEAVRILRDVADALGYAHSMGVVHRDIKPDNVLISHRHAVVTDFGVAKAVAASSGSSTLTSLGVALGTPAYMAPEQAAADPHVDHRADIYAAGVLAYEMLAGRLPFSASTPQQMLAAHVTQAPDSLVAHRSTVPPALAALIMRCLSKKPADRPQSALELVQLLDVIMTPSGGMTPTGSTPAISSGTEAAVRRAHPVRVATVFGVAGVAVLALVYFLMQRLGLPTWVFAAAGVLLVAGLPIMLVTGVFERRRALARTTGYVPTNPLAKWFTWRRAMVGGGLAFGCLAAAAAVYMTLRLLGIGSVGTLMAKGRLSAEDKIVLADFENHSVDTTLGSTLTEAFRVDLSQSRTVHLLDTRQVASALQRMQKPPGTPMTNAVAQDLAQREGAKAVVTGQISAVGKAYVLTVSVVSAADGSVLAAVRENADNDGALLGALDRLSKDLRSRIGESLTTLRASDELEQVTTSSLEALRKYSQGVRLSGQGEDEAAVPVLQQAVTLDTEFAMAYRKLAVVLGNTGASIQQQVDAVTKAYDHRDRLTPAERDQTVAYYFQLADFDMPKAIAAYRDLLAIDSNYYVGLNNLSILLIARREYAAAESLLNRGIAVGCGNCYQQLIQVALVLGQDSAARTLTDQYQKAFPNSPVAPAQRFWITTAERDYPGAERVVAQLRKDYAGSAFVQENVQQGMTAVRGAQGRLAEALQESRKVMAIAEQRGLPGDYINAAIGQAAFDVYYRDRPADALQKVGAALTRHPLTSLPVSDRPYSALAQAYALTGRVEQAKQLMTEYARLVPEGLRRANPGRHNGTAAIARAEHRYADALAEVRAFRDESGCAVCGLWDQATLFDQLHQQDSALVYYDRYLTTPDAFRIWDDGWELGPSYKRAGELHEARGDRAQALDNYNKFVDLWKNADAELQPVVRDVRGRIARLAAEH